MRLEAYRKSNDYCIGIFTSEARLIASVKNWLASGLIDDTDDLYIMQGGGTMTVDEVLAKIKEE